MSSDFTISGAIDLGEFPNEMIQVLRRLQKLPEWGLDEQLERVVQQCLKAHDVERRAKSERIKAREMAHALVRKAREQWSPAEILDATGYAP